MQKVKTFRSAVGAWRQLLILLCITYVGNVHSQEIEYDPDRIFSGSHYAFDLKWVSNFKTGFTHLEGFEHKVSSRPDFGYELGFKWRYYFNKHWSVETGMEVGSRRKLIFDYDLDNDAIKQSIIADPVAISGFENHLKYREVQKYGLGPTFALPVQVGYHQYLGRSQRHILDYKLGTAVRFHIPMYLYMNEYHLFLQTVDGEQFHMLLYRLTYDWYFGKKILFDLQSYFGYTFIPKNKHAFSIGLLANFSFEKDYQFTEEFKILPDTPYEGALNINMRPHYLAVQFGFTFTTKRNTLTLQKKKQNRRTGSF